jgi:hypothetical protein
MGVIDALQPSSGQSSFYLWDTRHPERFHIIVTDSGSKVASGSFSRSGHAAGVTVRTESLAATGFYGQFWRPRPRTGCAGRRRL